MLYPRGMGNKNLQLHLFSKEYGRYSALSAKRIKIEDDIWLVAGAIVLDGLNIGKGSVIVAGAVVTKIIPPYSVAVGVPARVVKKRA